MENFREIADELLCAGGALMVTDEESLTEKIRFLLSSPEKRRAMGLNARRVVENHRGASGRNLKMISDILASGPVG